MEQQTKIKDDVSDKETLNPFLHFIISELWAAAAAAAVYCIFRAGAYFCEWVGKMFPLSHPDPANFLELVLSWGAVLSTSSIFIIITAYQIYVLLLRLRKAVAV